ncbi:helicase-associated domain-containing protein [Nonomuraea solani]|uniref:helicase-associated domain-containing protein n=1 Tax=Nonomuraea solani TaxID=1144553 RepID=UPI00190EE72E|nr:helicase-associated domain-containing protein [Nonomuraea solani]
MIRETEAEAPANLHAVLQLCAAGRLRCGETTRRPSAATVTAVTSALAEGDFYDGEAIAAYAWPLLLQTGGLAELTAGKLRLTTRGHTALGRPPAETIKDLWRRWISGGLIDEFSRVEAIKGQRGKNVLTAEKPRRQKVATALTRCCEPGEWLTVDDLFAQMRAERLDPVIARSSRALWKLYLVDPEYGSLGYAGYADWPILEGRYTLAVLFEYAATLGLIDVTYVRPDGARRDYHRNWGSGALSRLSRYDGLKAIRLTTLGAYATGRTRTYKAPAAPAEHLLKVLPNFDIVVTGTLPPVDRLTLTAYAKQTSDHVWTLSARSLRDALGTGRSLDHLRTFLHDRCGHPLPGTVATLLTDVDHKARQVRDRGLVHLIEAADPATAVLIANDRKAGALCQLLGDRHLWVAPENEEAFRKAAKTLGYIL